MRAVRARCGGSALILAVIIVSVMAGMAVSLLTINVYQGKASTRGVSRESALTIAESGMDVMRFRLNTWTGGSPLTTVGPVSLGGGTYTATVTPAFSGTAGTYTIRSVGTTGTETRGIIAVVTASVTSVWGNGLVGDLSLTTSGSSFSDSYNSAAGTYASQATNYDAVNLKYYANTSGGLSSNGDISLSGGTFYGNVTPGPTGTLSSSAYISGSSAPAAAPQVFPPYVYTPPIAASGAYTQSGGTNTLTGGTYRFTQFTISGGGQLTLSGDVTIYVDAKFTSSGGSSKIILAPGARVQIHHGINDFTLSGGGVMNTSQIPSDFQVFSASTTKVTYSGGSAFHGAIYSPTADMTISGGSGFFGAGVGKSVTMSGGATFHYDEGLGASGTPGAYVLAAWREFAQAEWLAWAP